MKFDLKSHKAQIRFYLGVMKQKHYYYDWCFYGWTGAHAADAAFYLHAYRKDVRKQLGMRTEEHCEKGMDNALYLFRISVKC